MSEFLKGLIAFMSNCQLEYNARERIDKVIKESSPVS